MSASFHHKDSKAFQANPEVNAGATAQADGSSFMGVFEIISSRMQELERQHAAQAALINELSRKNQGSWAEHFKAHLLAHEEQAKEREEALLARCKSEAKAEIAAQIETERRRSALDLTALKAENARLNEQFELRLKKYAVKLVTQNQFKTLEDEFKKTIESLACRYADQSETQNQLRMLETEFNKMLGSMDAAMALASQREELTHARINAVESQTKGQLAALSAAMKVENDKIREKIFRECLEALKQEAKRSVDEAVAKTVRAHAQNLLDQLDQEHEKISSTLIDAMAHADQLSSACEGFRSELLEARKPYEEASGMRRELDELKRVLSEQINASEALDVLRREKALLKSRFDNELIATRCERASLHEELLEARKNLEDERSEIARLGALLNASESSLALSRSELAKIRTETIAQS
jgi:hypothetical protein